MSLFVNQNQNNYNINDLLIEEFLQNDINFHNFLKGDEKTLN